MVPYDNSFIVLPKTETVIGVNSENLRYLQAENFANTKFNRTQFNTKGLWVTTIAHNDHQSTLLVADAQGNVMAFKINPSDLSSARLSLDFGPEGTSHKYYSHLDAHGVYTCSQFGSFTVLAGEDVMLIDTATCRIKHRRLADNAVAKITSVQLCPMDRKVLLAVSGCKPDYSESKTDVFDVTDIVRGGRADPAHGQMGSDGEAPTEIGSQPVPSGFESNVNLPITQNYIARNSPGKSGCACSSKKILQVVIAKIEQVVINTVESILQSRRSELHQSEILSSSKPQNALPHQPSFRDKLHAIVNSYKLNHFGTVIGI